MKRILTTRAFQRPDSTGHLLVPYAGKHLYDVDDALADELVEQGLARHVETQCALASVESKALPAAPKNKGVK